MKRLLPCKPFYLIAHLKGVRMKKILTSALSLSLLACTCSPKVQGDNYEDLMSSAEKISKEGILDGDIDYRLLQFAINYLVSECRRDGELKKHSIDDEMMVQKKILALKSLMVEGLKTSFKRQEMNLESFHVLVL